MKRRRHRTPTQAQRIPAGEARRRSPFRVPFVRRCEVRFSDGVARGAFIANINEYGAYVADDVMPTAGQGMSLRFGQPGSDVELEATGAVAWVNPQQQHAVHSLPPGYAMKFDPLRAAVLDVVERVVDEFVRRQAK